MKNDKRDAWQNGDFPDDIEDLEEPFRLNTFARFVFAIVVLIIIYATVRLS